MVTNGEVFAGEARVASRGRPRAIRAPWRIAIAAFCVIVCALLASNLGRNDLIYGDEALYAISARNALHGVEFIANPSVKPLGPPGDKPFLYPLLIAAPLGIEALGDARGPRLVTLLVLMASAPLLALIGRALWSPQAGALALVLFIASPIVAHYGRWLRAEIPVMTAVVATAWAATRAVRTNRARWGFVAGALLGLGFLCKLWLVAPGAAVIGGVLALSSTGADRRPFRAVVAIALAAAGGFLVVAPAQLLLCAIVSPETLPHWLYIYFGFSFAERLAGEGYTEAWHQPWDFYFTQIGQMIGLVLPLAVAGAVALVPRRGDSFARRVAAGLIFGWIVPLVPLSLFSVKSGGYVLPILPAFFLLAAAGFTSLVASGEEGARRRDLRLAALVACVLCAASQFGAGHALLRPHSPVVAAIQLAWIALMFAASFAARGAAARWCGRALAACFALTVAAGVARDAQLVRDASRDIGYAALARRLAPALAGVGPHEPCFIAPAFPALSYSLFKTGRYWSVPYAGAEPDFAREALASEHPFFFVVNVPLGGVYGGAPDTTLLREIEARAQPLRRDGPRGPRVFVNDALAARLRALGIE
ncbi:MAG: ArnT family glycosyltransferase [bacterium]